MIGQIIRGYDILQ